MKSQVSAPNDTARIVGVKRETPITPKANLAKVQALCCLLKQMWALQASHQAQQVNLSFASLKDKIHAVLLACGKNSTIMYSKAGDIDLSHRSTLHCGTSKPKPMMNRLAHIWRE